MIKTFYLLNINFLLLFPALFNAQIDDSMKYHVSFFKKLSNNGGKWIAENPKYDSSTKNNFRFFLLEFAQSDSLSIYAKIKGVNHKNDTILFWSFTEFYSPFKKKSTFYQRSKNGLIYAIGESNIDSKERFCEMIFYYYNGKSNKHKDIHTFTNENMMISKSYDLELTTNQWINETILIWKKT